MTVKIINANPHGFLSQKKLDQFERETTLNLPSDYRNFLLQYNGGQPKPSFFWIYTLSDGSSVYQFYGLHKGPMHLSIDTYIGEERYGVPTSMIPIGDDGTGNFICLGTSSANFGKVFFLDHERHPFNKPNSSIGITLLANSFYEFLQSLIENPE